LVDEPNGFAVADSAGAEPNPVDDCGAVADPKGFADPDDADAEPNADEPKPLGVDGAAAPKADDPNMPPDD